MSFPRYPNYKDCGVEWLGEVPLHWGIAPLKRLFDIFGGSTPKSEVEAFWDGDIPWATPADLSKLDSIYLADTQRKITGAGVAACTTRIVPSGSIVLSTRAPIGSLAIAIVPLCTNQGCKSLVPRDSTNNKYFAYLLSVSTDELNIRGKGTTFLELSGDELGGFTVPVPPCREQAEIAAFLDRETAKIDALVAEQQRLMELLKEKRQAVISHAVTKGLNLHAPMKDSGIEWLGEVPAHWEVVVAKRVSNIFVPQRNKPELNSDHVGLGWVTMEQMGKEDISAPNLWVSDMSARDAGTRVLKAGAVIASCVGSFGTAALNNFDVIINQQLQAFIPHDRINARFLRHCVASAGSFFEKIGTAATITYVNQQGFENLPLAVPPLGEQQVIVKHVAHEMYLLDTLTAEVQRSVDLLQERRSALISAAVTGQIDVRQLAEKQAAA